CFDAVGSKPHIVAPLLQDHLEHFANRRLIINNKHLGFALPVFSGRCVNFGNVGSAHGISEYMGKIPVFEDPIVISNVLSKSAPRRFYLYHQGLTDRFQPPGLTRVPSESGPLTSLSGNAIPLRR